MNNWKIITVLLCLFGTYISLSAQEETETFTQTISWQSGKTVNLRNVNGSVSATGYNGTEIQVEMKRTIKAKSKAALERAKKELVLKNQLQDDNIWIYIDAPFLQKFGEKKSKWDDWPKDYSFETHFKLKIPRNAPVDLATVNEGDLTIRDIQGIIAAKNVNGSVYLENVALPEEVKTVNGDIKLTFNQLPERDLDIATVNGKVSIYAPDNLSAHVTIKTLNGSAYTDFDHDILAPEIIKEASNKSGGTKLKISSNSNMQIGKGGPHIDIKTLNGNIYIKNQ